MLLEPNCYKRKCVHLIGIIQPNGTEVGEVNACDAFPDGIPYEIAYGDNLHLEPCCGQTNSIVFESGNITEDTEND